MKQSALFTRTAKRAPEGEETRNAQLLQQGGFVHKVSAGVYAFLPLGLRVLRNVEAVIREGMASLGAEELFMPALIERSYWERSARADVAVMYRTGSTVEKKDGSSYDYGLGWTHEEVVTAIATQFIQSYRDLPKSVYQIQTKFRAELRPQGGLLRGREFSMNDLYSFHADAVSLEDFYGRAGEAYTNIFSAIGLDALRTEAHGGAFTTEYTHEFQVLHPSGEDTVHYCRTCGFSQNREIFKAAHHRGCDGELQEARGIEVGNIFKLGTRFSEAFGLVYANDRGEQLPVHMGSYGIGPSRLMGALTEVFSDERGIVWPKRVAPFTAHVLLLNGQTATVRTRAEALYRALERAGVATLYDDRTEVTAGEKFADADLIGIPYRIVVSEKTAPRAEIKERGRDEVVLLDEQALITKLTAR